jgi:hypothetical protein
VEVLTRTDSTIVGSILDRTPATYQIDYMAKLDASGRIASLDATLHSPGAAADDPSTRTVSLELSDGSANIRRTGGPNEGSATIDAPENTILTLGRSIHEVFVLEQIDRQVQAGEGVLLLGPTSAAARATATRIVTADTISVDYFGNPKYAWFTRRGMHKLLGASGARTTNKVEVRPTGVLDLAALGARWAAMDATGQGIGAPSPRETVAATLGDAAIEIDYSRPAKRGRDIWGALVPFGSVWRTGANAATGFTTSADLLIGDVSVPAGSYTLWSLFEEGAQYLIVNSETGQWGTAYDSSNDFARIPLGAAAADEPSERFTISVDARGEGAGGGVLSMTWDRTRYFVALQAQ